MHLYLIPWVGIHLSSKAENLFKICKNMQYTTRFNKIEQDYARFRKTQIFLQDSARFCKIQQDSVTFS